MDDRLVIAKIKEKYPTPTDCAQALLLMRPLNSDLAYVTQVKTSGNINDKIWAKTALGTYNSKLAEYSDFISSCAPSSLQGIDPNEGTTFTTDPVLGSTVVPGGNGIVPDPLNPTKPGSFAAQGSGADSPDSTTGKQLIKGIPNWALYTAGGLLIVIGIVVAVKKSS